MRAALLRWGTRHTRAALLRWGTRHTRAALLRWGTRHTRAAPLRCISWRIVNTYTAPLRYWQESIAGYILSALLSISIAGLTPSTRQVGCSVVGFFRKAHK